jgi:hypothetical protein
LILSALALPALSQAAVRVEYCKTGWPIRGAWRFSPTIRAC